MTGPGLRAAGRRAGGESGFTLLEVLVAFVIAALALGMLFEGALTGLRASQVSAQRREALLLARDHLAELGRGEGLTERETGGDDGRGFHWHLSVRPLASAPLSRGAMEDASHTPQMQAKLFAVGITESWGEGEAARQVRLDTQRLSVQPVAP